MGLQDVWPATRTILDGQSMGDVWSCPALKAQSPASPVDQLVPFHKLSQWLTYSIIDTIQQMDVVQFTEVELLTGLPEYRNGECFGYILSSDATARMCHSSSWMAHTDL